LNVNACEFVPRAKEDNDPSSDLNLGSRKTEPKLLLPWKGFPKLPRPERACKYANLQTLDIHSTPSPVKSNEQKLLPTTGQEPKASVSLKRGQSDRETMALNAEIVGKKPLKEKVLIKETPADVKRREQERKVALEALKLVEQRRLRDELEEKQQPEVIVHLSREAVNFTAEERVRVDKLRAIKREQIERVLREMRHEQEQQYDAQLEQKLDQKLAFKPEQKQPRTTQRLPTVGRYVALQRAVKKEPEEVKVEATVEPKLQLLPEDKLEPPRRYIPTVKQWDERCKAKASANKENYMTRKPLAASDEQLPLQRAMAPSSIGNIMPSIVKEALPKSDKDQGLFVPRYWPPAPKVASGEKRRGNLIHARNISRAFANCGLLPTPSIPGVTLAPEPTEEYSELAVDAVESGVKRYDIKRLLELEPQPEQLQTPCIRLDLRQLGILGD
ncbi:hypothetical protein KR044_013142, partial [Drosophila immigrans]